MNIDAIGAVGGQSAHVGRYFTVVSALPSTVFFAYVYILIKTGAWSGPVRWPEVVNFEPAQLLVVGLAALVLALALNPVQVDLVRLFEGYWGSNPFAQQLATMRIMHHRRVRTAHRIAAGEASLEVDPQTLDLSNAPPGMVAAAVRAATNGRAAAPYPDNDALLLPTRLGNVLRSYESRAGQPYEIEAIRTIPRLAMVAGEREVAYLQNQRMQLELAVRTSLLSLIAAVVTTVFFFRHGSWLLIALAPYAVAFLAYRGSVALAHEYGMSVAAMIDISRFRLYEQLRLPVPSSHSEERAQNRRLMDVFAFGGEDLGRYAEPPVEQSPAAMSLPPMEGAETARPSA